MSGLLYAAALILVAWGVAHLVPTPQVVAGFGAISVDNRRILTMEWIAEGIAMIFVGLLIAAVTAEAADSSVTRLVCRLSAGLLAAIAVLTALTGARTPIVWFRACPVVMAVCIALLLVGSAG